MATANDRRAISLGLAAWAGASMILALGTLMIGPNLPTERAGWFAQALGSEFLLWGLLEVGFAFVGLHAARHPRDFDSSKIVRLLRFIVSIDVIMILLSILVIAYAVLIRAHASGRPGALLAGHGVGIMLQCGFIFLLARHFIARFGGSIAPTAPLPDDR